MTNKNVWFTEFEDDPERSVALMLYGVADVGSLGITDRVDILLGWIKIYADEDNFAEKVDVAIAKWVADIWGDETYGSYLTSLDNPGKKLLTGAAWLRVASIVRNFEIYTGRKATHTLAELKSAYESDSDYLKQFYRGRSCNPALRIASIISLEMEEVGGSR